MGGVPIGTFAERALNRPYDGGGYVAAPLRISIITPSYQQASFLEECIASVHDASYVPWVEHIVVDGGSTDGSKAILEKHADQFAWWCSEKDGGQSDAINKGLAHATGDVFGWLNSDDHLLNGVLNDVASYFSKDPSLLVLGGMVEHIGPGSNGHHQQINDIRDTERLFVEPVINQPATFWRMEQVRAIGGVDPALRYVMDLELWWQVLFRYGTGHLRFEPITIAAFRLHQESKTSTSILGFLDETASLLHDLCVRTGNTDLAAVLAKGHPLRQGLRGIPAGREHAALVRRMTLHFLLKWNVPIHRANQFAMMRALRASGVAREDLTPDQRERWAQVQDQIAGTWTWFRVKRKLKDLRR